MPRRNAELGTTAREPPSTRRCRIEPIGVAESHAVGKWRQRGLRS
jgi:hypothetical protein